MKDNNPISPWNDRINTEKENAKLNDRLHGTKNRGRPVGAKDVYARFRMKSDLVKLYSNAKDILSNLVDEDDDEALLDMTRLQRHRYRRWRMRQALNHMQVHGFESGGRQMRCGLCRVPRGSPRAFANVVLPVDLEGPDGINDQPSKVRRRFGKMVCQSCYQRRKRGESVPGWTYKHGYPKMIQFEEPRIFSSWFKDMTVKDVAAVLDVRPRRAAKILDGFTDRLQVRTALKIAPALIASAPTHNNLGQVLTEWPLLLAFSTEDAVYDAQVQLYGLD